MNFSIRPACGLLLLALAACGGGGSDGFDDAVAKASAKQVEAQTLAADSPCSSTAQCDSLAFLSPTAVCSTYSYKPYSLVAASASAASAAAAEQRALANQAIRLGPNSGVACVAVVNPPPTLTCRASTCQVQ